LLRFGPPHCSGWLLKAQLVATNVFDDRTSPYHSGMSLMRTSVVLSTGIATGIAICYAIGVYRTCRSGSRRIKRSQSAASIMPEAEFKHTFAQADSVLPVLDLSKPDKENFMVVFDIIVKEMSDVDRLSLEPNMVEWVEQMFRYNVPHGKLNRGLAVVAACKIMNPQMMKNKRSYFAACVVGWCIEWLQAFFLVADDIMDHSITRRGQPCWYKVPKVGLMAVNDCCILEGAIYRLLRRYVQHLPCYADVVDLFHEVTYATTMGQLLDMLTSPEGKDNFEAYNLTLYSQIVKFKTAFYTFYLPTASAMQLCGVMEPKHYETAKKICMMIGEFFQIQDDFLDCYGEPEVIGKIGTDIEDNKCSWLICQAKSKASKAQLVTLRTNYGKSNPKSVAKIKALFRELKLEDAYAAYEVDAHARICGVVDKEVPVNLQPLYQWYLEKIFKRSK